MWHSPYHSKANTVWDYDAHGLQDITQRYSLSLLFRSFRSQSDDSQIYASFHSVIQTICITIIMQRNLRAWNLIWLWFSPLTASDQLFLKDTHLLYIKSIWWTMSQKLLVENQAWPGLTRSSGKGRVGQPGDVEENPSAGQDRQARQALTGNVRHGQVTLRNCENYIYYYCLL